MLVPVVALAMASGCAKPEESTECAPRALKPVSGESGVAQAFLPDPVNASGIPSLSPTSLKLDLYRSSVALSNLGGLGVLEGRFVDVRNGLTCDEWFGAHDEKNQFSYSHGDSRFQEAMAYHFGDRYRAEQESLGFLFPSAPVRIVAHCMKQDNAYFTRHRDEAGEILNKVCLGDSVATPGASYGDDAVVTLHELQHATTTDLYTGSQASARLNQFWYDEAGALNEAVSDFMALAHSEPLLSAAFDPRQFSRWALDRFYPGRRAIRGTHRCPEYDSAFASGCTGYPGFSSDGNTVSYVYPDGLGWPYADNYGGADPVRSVFKGYRGQEEIHNTGVLLSGALWDVYESLKSRHDGVSARSLAMKLVLEAVRHLPRPSAARVSPVSFRSFASAIQASMPLVGLSADDQAGATQALTERGLLGGTILGASWAQAGEGMPASPGLRIEDHPTQLKSWLFNMGSDPELVTQGISTGLNSQLDPGDLVAIWFDVKNVAQATAGGVELTVISLDPEVTFLDNGTNIGALSESSAQIHYSKVNGTEVVSALTGPTYGVGTGNSYFKTNPYYSRDWTTAVFAKVSPSAAHGKTVTFQVEASPSNGEKSVVQFTARIR